VASSSDLRRAVRGRVRLSTADFTLLDRHFPGRYPRLIVAGEGAYLTDAEGRRLLDSGAHMGACQIGHGRREVSERIAAQAAAIEFTTLDSGLAHPYAVALADRLAPRMPLAGEPLFLFGASGSEANETAFKVARAYHAARGEPGRRKVLCRAGSYHGATFAAMAATGIPAAREPFAPLPPGFVRVTQPSPGRCGYCPRGGRCTLACAEDVERALVREGPESVAALVAEPVAFREAVKVPDPGYWPALREICDRHGVLLIADEVITGFGRTGRFMGSAHWDLQPDVVVLAKGLTSGYVPMSACVVSGAVAETLRAHPMTHISTYAGHPVACAAAEAALDVLDGERLPERAAALEPVVRDHLTALAERVPAVTATSVIGLLASVEVAVEGDPALAAARVTDAAYERGLIVRVAPAEGEIVAYFYPPLVVDADDVAFAFGVLAEVLG
jgi:adenosylmethionine-8-amino-7-oxononanoate aminotransferase